MQVKIKIVGKLGREIMGRVCGVEGGVLNSNTFQQSKIKIIKFQPQLFTFAYSIYIFHFYNGKHI